MEKFALTLTEREKKTPRQLRREGKIPGTVYGAGTAPINVQMEAREFTRLPQAAHSHIIELTGAGKPSPALIRNVQRKAINSQVLNVEFYRVRADKKITVTVPIKFVGTSEAVSAGGQLVEIHQEVHLECLPGDIPEHIEVDLGLIVEIDQGIHFKELKLGDKVKILNPEDETIVRVITPRQIVEEAPPETPAASEVPTVAGEAAPAETTDK